MSEVAKNTRMISASCNINMTK